MSYKGITSNYQWTMSVPTKVEFGLGSLDTLKKHVNGYHKAILITGRNAMKKAGITDRIIDILKEVDVACEVFNNVSPDPDCTEVDQAAAMARKFGADIVIGCGGGSSIDAAKAVTIGATHDGPILDYRANGPREITDKCLPLIAISGTSGTGSHIGRASVISDRSQSIKRAVLSDMIYPKVAICDPEVLKTMPPDVTAATGFDAFTHALEGYLASVENPLGNLCALEAMGIIINTLPATVKDGNNLELRTKMSWADTLAGVSLASQGITTPHALAMVIGGKYGVTHGCALAAVTVAWVKRARAGAEDKLVDIAHALGCESSMQKTAAVDWAIEQIENLINSIGLCKGVCDYGVSTEGFEAIIADAQVGFDFRLKADPVPATADGLNEILVNSK